MLQQDKRLSPLRIEITYAGAMGTYCAGNCALTTFIAVFLSYHGFSDGQIGYTTALIYLTTIAFQLTLSAYSDKHPALPLRKIILGLYLLTLAAAGTLYLLPLPVLAMMLIYTLACGSNNCTCAMLTALMMKYLNRGIPVRYGWPRGVGSIAYASLAAVLGGWMETFSPDIMLPIFLIVGVLCIVTLFLMPAIDDTPIPKVRQTGKDSYFFMLRSNPTLLLLLCACVISGMGSASFNTYLIRIIQRLGGTSHELGLAVFLQSGVELPAMLCSPLLLKKFSPKQLLTFSFLVVPCKLTLILLSRSLTMLFCVLPISICCFGLYGFASVLFANSIVPENQTVRAQSLLALSYTSGLGGILGNIFSGAFIDRIGLTALLWTSIGIVVLGASIMVCCARSHAKRFPQAK